MAHTQIRYGVLGSFTAWWDDREIELGPAKQQAVLAALLLEMNRPVSMNAIIDGVWGEHPPSDARNGVQTYVSRLRRVLAPRRRVAEPALVRADTGYVLHGDPSLSDHVAFDRLIATAERCRRDRDLAAAAANTDAALALWRGEPFSGLAGPIIEAERRRLQERYLAALEHRAGIKLARGQHAEAVAELAPLVSSYPLQERFRTLLMLGLYHCGRQAEALMVFQDAQRRLAEEIGIEPGRELRELHRRILRDEIEPPLEAARTPTGRHQSAYGAARFVDLDKKPRVPAAAPTVADAGPRTEALPSRNQLPGDIADFTGRDAELARLLADIPPEAARSTVLIEAIDGMAGVGKTTLAIHAAHQLSSRFPDAQLYLDLHGHAVEGAPIEPMVALERLLRAVGVPSESIPPDLDARAALWRTEIAALSALLVLDNVADAEQIRPLLPGTPSCLVLITSRRRLVELEVSKTLTLDSLSHQDATTLFTSIVTDERVRAEPDAMDETVRLCGHLPLAIRIAAGRLRARPVWPVERLAERLRDPNNRLDHLAAGSRSVSAALAASFQDLPPEQQRAFRLLGLHPGRDFDIYATAALTDLSIDAAEQILEDLVDVHLLEQVVSERYRFHNLVRDYAVTLIDPSDLDCAAALTRLFDYYRYAAWAVGSKILPDRVGRIVDLPRPSTPLPALAGHQDCVAWLHSERLNLLAIAREATKGRWSEYAGLFSEILWWPYVTGLHCTDDAITLHFDAVEVARNSGEQAEECRLLVNLGYTLWRMRHCRQALVVLNDAVGLAHGMGDFTSAAKAMHHSGLVYFRLARYRDALMAYHQALSLARACGDKFMEGYALQGLGQVQERMGYYDGAFDYLRQAVGVAEETGDPYLRACALMRISDADMRVGRYDDALAHLEDARKSLTPVPANTLFHNYFSIRIGNVYCMLKQYDAALDSLRTALARAQRNNDLIVECCSHLGIGDVHRRKGDYREALAHYERALHIAYASGSPYEELLAFDAIATVNYCSAHFSVARKRWKAALKIAAGLGLPETQRIANHVASIDSTFVAASATRTAEAHSAEFRRAAELLRGGITPKQRAAVMAAMADPEAP
ncbi:DNA-binding SARP family transcriptional activator [Nocardia tenerifensis]|uniref:DNA-binding SARP family transcriptional activator n=1 Tax=Nocardia tenerifensis TaxID=228006 RepID=A0A318KG79_9NOCA|nr:BTAD domain-containing putative transcriptional regulator [Nocardia tenerifensis]PXX71183.1 DNA-binding SARP family transcriptional activator [Nocardia tenerifensis]